MKTIVRLFVISIICLAITIQAPATASGRDSLAPAVSTITVNTLVDEISLTPNGACSLREAIHKANWGGIADCPLVGSGEITILLPAGTYYLRLGTPGPVAGENGNLIGDLDIYDGMTIDGEGIGITIIDAENFDRVFDIFAGYLETVTLRDLSVYNGNPGSASGGGIRNTANLILDHVRLDHNHSDTLGGGIYNKAALPPDMSEPYTVSIASEGSPVLVTTTLNITDSILASNTAKIQAGGIYNDAASAMAISDSTLFFNQAGDATVEGGGCGAIYNLSELDVTLDRVLISDNIAINGHGGGFCSTNVSPGDSVIIRDSDFAVNYAVDGYGGNILHGGIGTLELIRSEVSLGLALRGAGIYSSGNMDLTNVTIADNEATEFGGGIYVTSGYFGMLHITLADNVAPIGAGFYKAAGDAEFGRTIIARNTTPGGAPANCAGAIIPALTSLGYNLTDGSFCAAPMAGDLHDTDPGLGSYDQHGGVNETNSYALLYNSLAIDATNPAWVGGPYEDQHGKVRPYDGNRDGIAVSDIGAFEFYWIGYYLPLVRK